MKLDRKALALLPSVINKEQLRIVGNMSKRTATYLLVNNIIPSVHTGKKTRCYEIQKRDVIAFFNDLNLHPEKYASIHQQDGDTSLISAATLPTFKYSKKKLKAYYQEALTYYENDLLTVDQVLEITGYRNTSVTSWIRDEKLEALILPTKYLIPKKYLLKWLLSDQYNSIERKSHKHLKALWEAR